MDCHPILTNWCPSSAIPTIFMPDALPRTTFAIYPGLGQAQNMLACIPGGLVHTSGNTIIKHSIKYTFMARPVHYFLGFKFHVWDENFYGCLDIIFPWKSAGELSHQECKPEYLMTIPSENKKLRWHFSGQNSCVWVWKSAGKKFQI